VETLLSYRANANLVDSATGKSALTLALTQKFENMVTLILKYGADPDKPDGHDVTARMILEKVNSLRPIIEKWDKGGAAAFEVHTPLKFQFCRGSYSGTLPQLPRIDLNGFYLCQSFKFDQSVEISKLHACLAACRAVRANGCILHAPRHG
jgi:hypothetical protein